MQDWKIQKSARVCGACGREFAAGDVVFSAIFARDADEFERTDSCPDCWAERESRAAEAAAPFSYWKTRMPRAKEPARISYDRVEEFFRGLVVRQRETGEASRLLYPLALLLLRRKVLVLRRTSDRRGCEVLHFVERASEEEIEVVDPGLDADGLAALEGEIRGLLFPEGAPGGGVPGDASPGQGVT